MRSVASVVHTCEILPILYYYISPKINLNHRMTDQ